MRKGKTKQASGLKKVSKKATKPTVANEATPKAEAQKAAAKKSAKPKRVSALDAAATVLKSAGKPMRAQELIAAMAEKGLWTSPAGRTPSATLYAAITREITAKGKDARFGKVDRGQFQFNAGDK